MRLSCLETISDRVDEIAFPFFADSIRNPAGPLAGPVEMSRGRVLRALCRTEKRPGVRFTYRRPPGSSVISLPLSCWDRWQYLPIMSVFTCAWVPYLRWLQTTVVYCENVLHVSIEPRISIFNSGQSRVNSLNVSWSSRDRA